MRKIALAFILILSVCELVQAQGRPPLLPPDWQADTDGSTSGPPRYISPDGSAWISMFATPAGDRMQISVRPDEEITYKRVTPRFVAVSGFKGGDRIFYRKSNLACGGKRWHHLVVEYDAADKRKMDALVTRLAHGMNRYNRSCPG
jgi:hypothetical protein